MSKQFTTVKIYKQPYQIPRELDVLLCCVESGDFSKDVADSIKQFICSEIANAKNTAQTDKVEAFGRGSTSVCFRSVDNDKKRYIYKQFYPQDTKTVTVQLKEGNGCFVWLSDDATEDERASFLRRFVRFVDQIKLIQDTVTNANTDEHNSLLDFELALTSLGLTWCVNVLYGNTLQEVFNEPCANLTVQHVYNRMQLVLNLAKDVQFFHRHKIFHGDIKPNNYLKADFKLGNYDVCNIDYDTCVTEEQLNSGYLDHFLSTTTSFYSSSMLKKLVNSHSGNFDGFAAFDVKALAKNLMYALDFEGGVFVEEASKDRLGDELRDWNDIFEKSRAYRRLFYLLGANKKLSSLYIINKLTQFLKNCSYNCKRSQKISTVESFISQLTDLVELIGEMFSICSCEQMTQDILKCRGLDELQKQQEQQLYFLNDVVNREFAIGDKVEKILSECFEVKDKSFDVKRIDKRLLPNIDGDEEVYGPIEVVQPANDAGVSTTEIETRWYSIPFKFGFNGDTPLNQLLEAKTQNIFLSANGGVGKSTTLFTFWLDYLLGVHQKPCIYIDLKRLELNDEANAIRRFVKKKSEYTLDLESTFKQADFIILLDGANEADEGLRRSGVSDCFLVEETKHLMALGYRVVLSNRTETVHTLSSQSQNREFDKECMLYCKLSELTDEQLLAVKPDIDKASTTYKLLKNNMMLSIFGNLKGYGMLQDEKNVTGGQLLQKYFEICFKVRYIKNLLKTKDGEVELYAKIVGGQIDDKIYDAIDKYKKVYDFLIEHACCQIIDGNEIKGNRVFDITEHLGILTNNGENYVWTNEIYQEYFKARLFVNILARLEAGEEYTAPLTKSKRNYGISYNVLCIDNDFVLYNSFEWHYSGYFNPFVIRIISELEAYSQQRLDTISLKAKEDDYASVLVINLAQLLGLDIPSGITKISTHSFKYTAKKIAIPKNIKIIDRQAFISNSQLEEVQLNCDSLHINEYAFTACSNLKSVKFNCSYLRIGKNAFGACESLDEIVIPCKVKFDISSGAFADCLKLKHVTMTDVEYIDTSAFHNCKALETVQLDGNIQAVNNTFTFYECPSLKQVTVNGVNLTELKRVNLVCENSESKRLNQEILILKTVWGYPTDKENK